MLRQRFPRDNIKAVPYQKILTDIFNPEVFDLLLTMSTRHTSRTIENISPFSFSSATPASDYSNTSSECPQACNHQFATPQLIRPQSLGFSAKLPLTMTKSIEDMLRPPGMNEDSSIMNRPLARDWADGLRLTPMFNRDVVAQFFPELSENPIM